jgi:hypothetical protein
MKTLYLLLLLVVIIIGVLIYQKIVSVEGFADTDQVELSFCPHNMQSYQDSKTSDTVCCDGAVADNICSGDSVCTLTPSSASKLPACSTYMKEYNALKAKEHCFDTMSQYYEDDSQKPIISGCASKVNKDTSAPTLGAKSCKVYSTAKLNQYKFDSCENHKMVYLGKNSNFCKTANCTDVGIGGNEQDVAWITAYYMTQNGSTPVQAYCETKESITRHLKQGYGDWFGNEAWAQPKTGQELADALAKVEEGTYPGMCPLSAPLTPRTIPLEKLQEMFNKAGCTRVLTEAGQVQWWRTQPSIENIQNDMNAYGSLTKGCTGSTGQHEFCSPGKCSSTMIQYVMIRGVSGTGLLGISQIVVKNKQGQNIARKPKAMWASPDYNPDIYPTSRKERVVDGVEKARYHPDIYHSIETDRPYLTIEFNTPINLSNIASITVYGREGCCPERNANKVITLYKQTAGGGTAPENIVWTSPVTNSNVVQTFNVS